MTLLALVKMRCGIPEKITIYDEAELIPLIRDAIDEMRTSGVPEEILPADPSTNAEECNQRVVTCIVCYVQIYRGNDRSDTGRYKTLFRDKLHKLMLEVTA